MANCTEVSSNSDQYLAYALCEEPLPLVVFGAVALLVFLCLCFGCGQDKYSRLPL